MIFPYTPGEVHPELISTFERAIKDDLIRRFPDSTGGLSVYPDGGDVIGVRISVLGRGQCGQWTQLLTQQIILESRLGLDGMAKYLVDKWAKAMRMSEA